MPSLTILNADGLDPNNFPGYMGVQPTIRFYYDVAPGTLSVKVMTGDWSTEITRKSLTVTPPGKDEITFPQNIPVGSYVLIIEVNGVSQVWVYFSTGSIANVFGVPLNMVFIGIAALTTVTAVLGYGICALKKTR